jgi:hypothetical protein
MKWDIDKAIRALETSNGPGTVLERVVINPQDVGLLAILDLKLTPKQWAKAEKENLQTAVVWAFGIGRLAQRKLFFHAWTIREAYLKARRKLKTMSKGDLEWYGVQLPKKSNSFAAAKRDSVKRKRNGRA